MKPKVPTAIRQKNYIAWPTVGLFLAAMGANIGSFFLRRSHPISALLISSAASYSHFTVAHDAVHHSVSRNRWINNSLGFMSQFWLGPTSNWWALKYCHLRHHANTNDMENDPDAWASADGPGGALLTPLRWATIDLHYWTFYREIIRIAPIPILLYHGLIWTLIGLSYKFGFFQDLLWGWIIPSRVAMFSLSIFFDFLPHYPHKIIKKEDPYRTTSYISIARFLRPLLSALVLHQNYHVAHHLYPTVPFYRYGDVWEEKKDELLQIPVPILRILPQLGLEDLNPSKLN
jgi:fatty acid desaturase